jgi:pimeloyl-ACP methyl ester carboxylesterase
LVVLLHGFPGFWFTWRHQISALAQRGFRVVAPDMRGYNVSSKPDEVAAYEIGRLATDVRELVAALAAPSALLVGHDWGGAVAWWTAMTEPDVVQALAVLNCPHPRKLQEGLMNPVQLARSAYVLGFQVPSLPEQLLGLGDWMPLRWALEHDAEAGTFSEEDIDAYTAAWSQPGAMTAALNYYRALSLDSPSGWLGRLRAVDAPTLVVWGDRDRYLGADLAEPSRTDVPNLARVVHLETASHWVQEERPDQVSQLLADFFADQADTMRLAS